MFLTASVISGVGAYLVGRIADQGLANFFGEATTRHGTHPLAWLSIHILGAIPQMGGNSTGGSSEEVSYYNRGWFFIARGPRHAPDLNWAWKRIYPRGIPRLYCFMSTNNFLKKFWIPSFISIPMAFFTAVVLPPIKLECPRSN